MLFLHQWQLQDLSSHLCTAGGVVVRRSAAALCSHKFFDERRSLQVTPTSNTGVRVTMRQSNKLYQLGEMQEIELPSPCVSGVFYFSVASKFIEEPTMTTLNSINLVS